MNEPTKKTSVSEQNQRTGRELSAEEIAQFSNDGFLIVRGVFSSAEAVNMRREADRLSHWTEAMDPSNLRTEHAEQSGTLVINKYDPVVDVSPVFTQAARDCRITGRVSQLMGEPARLFKDKLIFKMPGHQGFGPTRTTLGGGLSRSL